jgi:putative tryptophan/tyrosine transport system substrate-binding protein
VKRRHVVRLLAVALGTSPFVGTAQQKKTRRIGVLSWIPFSSITFQHDFPAALAALGYREDDTIVLDWRSAESRTDHLDALAADLAADADVIVTVTNADTLAAKRATTTVPIVMLAGGDPVNSGLVASFARPGGNVTGSTWLPPETVGKVFEILKEANPGITRAAFLTGTASFISYFVPATEAAAQAIGVALRIIELPPEQDAAGILEEVPQWHPDALVVSPTPAAREAILGFAARNRLLAVYFNRGWVDSGGLIGYIPNGRNSGAGCPLRRPHLQGREARRPPHRAANPV